MVGPGGYDVADGCYTLLSSRQCNLFFDVFHTGSGKKLFTISGHFSQILPDGGFAKPGWVTERYFVIPLAQQRERCLVCEFGQTK